MSFKLNTAYYLSHNGLGDNITSIGAINFLLKYYNVIYFLCKDIYKKNVELLFLGKPVVIVDFPHNNEFAETKRIISNAYYNDNNINIFICGCHRTYINSYITHPELLNRQQDNTWKCDYEFIEKFYTCINLDLSIYYNYFNIPSNEMSINCLKSVEMYKIIFCHTKGSDREINIDKYINKYINDNDYICVCTNKNLYNVSNEKHKIANYYINLPIVHYIDIIKKCERFFIINSCFSCIFYPLSKTKRLKAIEGYIITNKNDNYINEQEHDCLPLL